MSKSSVGVGTQLPLLTPRSDWKRPTELPDLRGRTLVGLDTECRDDSLSVDRGPGWAYGAGYVAGVSWSAEGSEGYAPIRHPDSDCFDPEQVGRWLHDLVKSGTRLVFQNAPFDLGWFWAEWGIDVPPEYPLEDALACDFMIDENHMLYNLDAICARLGLPGKDEALMREAGTAYLRPPNALKSWRLSTRDFKSNIWRLPARYVGPYATQDARSARLAVQQMRPALKAQGLEDAYRLEMDLVPTVRRMRSAGLRLDVGHCERTIKKYTEKREEALRRVKELTDSRRGVTMEDVMSPKWMEVAFTAAGISFPRTAKTAQGSFTKGQKGWMEKHPHPLCRAVCEASKFHNVADKFVQGYLLDYAHRGRLHAEIHQYKTDDGGTVSYRLSYSDPPLQQMSGEASGMEIMLDVRGAFLADEGSDGWWCNDYSQQEYRLTAHFAALCKVRGGAEAVAAYVENPDLDYHSLVAEWTGEPRPRAKIQNFAILYGQGLDATAEQLGVSKEEAEALRDKVADKAPFGPALSDYVKRVASKRGYIRLLDGARCRWDLWESGWLTSEERRRGWAEKLPMAACSYEEAVRRQETPDHPWSNSRLRRAYTNKAMNRLVQGSAARQTKIAMRACARAGLDMRLQMHDELNGAGSKLDGARAAEIMRDCVPLLVPMKVDAGHGRSWAKAKGK